MAEASSNSTSELNTGASIKQPGDGFPTANTVEREINEASSILAVVSSKFDWVLFVEGSTDKRFYEKIIFQESEGSYDRNTLEMALKKTEELKESLKRADEFKKVYTMVDDWQKSAQAMYSNPALYLNDFWGKTKSLCMDLLSDDDMTETLVKKDYDGNKDSHVTIFLYERVVPFYKKYLASLKDKGFNDRFSRDLLKKISKETWNADYVEHEGAKFIKKKLETKWSKEIGSAKESLKSLISILNKKKANSIILESANKLEVDLGKLQISANSEEVLNGSDILEESLKDLKNTKAEKNKDKKKRIFNLIQVKNRLCPNPHFYGIVDKDYDTNGFDESIKDFIRETDANSLETMLIKYADKYKEDNIIDYLLKVFSIIYKDSPHRPTNSEAMDIYDNSKKFAFKIGLLRKEHNGWKPWCRFKYGFSSPCENTGNYSKTIKYSEGKYIFDENMYINKFLYESNPPLGKQSDKYKKIKKIINQPITDKDIFDICHGHDFVHFICALFYRLQNPEDNEGNVKGGTEDFIDAFNIEWFEKSPLYRGNGGRLPGTGA